jgi:type VI protein secretion system component VasK
MSWSLIMGLLLALFILLILLVIVVALAGSAFWIWMLVDCGTNKRISDSQRIVWLLVIIFTHLLGALIYFFVGRKPHAPTIAYGQPYAQPVHTPRQDSPYHPYQEGYQAQKAGPPRPHPSEVFHLDEQPQSEAMPLEQPQAQYPNIPPQE